MPDVLMSKLNSGNARVCVVGLGYVGYPLAIAAFEAGFSVTGIDTDAERIIREKGKKLPFKVTHSFEKMATADVTVICVPTPVDRYRIPDLSAVRQTGEMVVRYVNNGSLIILESTTYPGTTREFFVEPFERKGWRVGRDIYIAYCPERINPGSKKFTIANTPRVIGGATRRCSSVAEAFYRRFVKAPIVILSSPEAAEMTKIFENVFRNVNIALVNELAMLCRKMGIDVWEVIDAASTKPFGFMPFYPGPGVGGHCIPVDPFYLAHRARAFNTEARFIQLAGEINSGMPVYVVERCAEVLNNMGLCLRGARVLMVGVTYKENIADLRNSPALEIMRNMLLRGVRLSYFDPYISEISIDGVSMRSLNEKQILRRRFDLGVLTTPHENTPFDVILKRCRKVFDTRGVLRNVKSRKVIFL